MPLPLGCTDSWQKCSHYLFKKKAAKEPALVHLKCVFTLDQKPSQFLIPANLRGPRLKNKLPEVMFFSGKLHLSLSGHALCTSEAQG